MNWKPWLHGLGAAAIGGAANAVIARVTDPATYTDWTRLGEFAAMSALVNVAFYLKSPTAGTPQLPKPQEPPKT